jgi:1,2-diacylglycerol 3-alpha-glucosyltransferase
MRILIAETSQYIAFQGQAIFTINLAEGLAKNGHIVTVLAGSDRGHAYSRDLNRVHIESLRAVDLRAFHPDVCLPLFSARAVRQVMKDFHPDIVHIQDHYFVSRNATIAARQMGIHCVGTNHFMPENLAPYVPVISKVKPVYNWVLWHWMRNTYDRLDAVAAPSGTASDILRIAGLRPPVHPVSCGTDTRLFHTDASTDRTGWRKRYGIDPHKTIFFFVGRVDREKHLDLLIQAVHRLDRNDIQLVIGGKGAYKNKLQTMVEKYNLVEKVHFTGFVPQEDLPFLLNSIDVFVIPSEAELLSIATLQAMACSRPILAADAVALPELVTPGVNGFLIQPRNVEDAVRHMDWFASHPERWAEMGAASLEKVQPHSLENMVIQYENLYKQVLAGSPI